MVRQPGFEFRNELPGWGFLWARLECERECDPVLTGLLWESSRRQRAKFDAGSLALHPPIVALRRLFKAAGTDPSRYRPASEALLRRVLKGEDLPSIHVLVDFNNLLSMELACPCCVMAEGTIAPPFLFRAGLPGESYESLKGPFSLEGRPLLVDARGPLDAPITGSERVKVLPQTRRAWLVSYLPGDAVTVEQAEAVLEDLACQAPAIRVEEVFGG